MFHFLLGLLLGGAVGVIAMCLMQINRNEESEEPQQTSKLHE